MIRCKLCGETLPNARFRTHCSCGWRLSDDCIDDHDEWCPSDGDEPWVGAVEF